MKRYALLSNNIVMNVIMAAEDPDGIYGNWVACGDAGIGYVYDGSKFSPPEEVTDTSKSVIEKPSKKSPITKSV